MNKNILGLFWYFVENQEKIRKIWFKTLLNRLSKPLLN